MRKYQSYFLLFALIGFTSCNKNNLNDIALTSNPTNDKAYVKFINSYTALTPSIGTPANGPNVDFYVNGAKTNGAAGTTAVPLGIGVPYGSIFPNISSGYIQTPSDVVNIKAVLNRPTGGGLPSDTIANYNYRLAAGGYYTILLSDVNPNPTPATPNMMLIGESIAKPAYGFFKLRLLNMYVNNQALELYNSTSATVITSGIVYKNLSNWIELPLHSVSNVYQIRVAGTTTVLGAFTAFTPSNLRSYTFWIRGNPAVTGRPIAGTIFTTW
ncbi:MAG: DUF4397 domain-containing protein [Ferruginibacter sp.]|nr:DUF4397 domain-containing protein [Ferruginibacter sp.]